MSGVVLFTVSVLGLVAIGVGLINAVFFMAIRERDWATVLFILVVVGLAVAGIAGMFLLDAALPRRAA